MASSRLSIRRFRGADLEAVVRIEKQAFPADAWPKQSFLGYETDRAALFYVAAKTGEICGYSLTRIARGTAELYSVAVAPRARGRGVARALLRKTLRETERAGAASLWLTVRLENAAAIGLYTDLGFRRTRLVRRYYEDGSDGVRMRKRSAANDPR